MGLERQVLVQRCQSEEAWRWMQQGWRFFMRNPLIWLGFSLLYLSWSGLLSPLNMSWRILVAQLVMPFWVALGTLGIHHQDRITHFEFLWSRLRQASRALAGVGVTGSIGMWFSIWLFEHGSGIRLADLMTISSVQNMPEISLGYVLLFLVANFLLLLLTLYAPALILFHQLSWRNALWVSLFGCLRNLLPLFMFGMMALLLSALVLIVHGIALLLVWPLLMLANYAAYRAIFSRPAHGATIPL